MNDQKPHAMTEKEWLDLCDREDADAVMRSAWSRSDLLRDLIYEAMRDVKGPAAQVVLDHCWNPEPRTLDTEASQ